jgi:cellulose synthase/poly-beta-1,6-N-acetylglucosamine synthase-like glycosyltransferase
MSILPVAIGALALAAGLLPAAAALYLLGLAVACFRYREGATGPLLPAPRLFVLVPAHNESALIARCVHSLLAQEYPRDHLRVIVIADNCVDDTAEVARAAGAEVMVRTVPDVRGKGHALRWAMDRLFADPDPSEAMVIVDADSVVDEHFAAALAGELSTGHDVVQAEYLVLEEANRSSIQAVALLLFHRVRFCGRAALGLPANLVGNGMLLSRRALERCPWDAFTGAEDLEYSIKLRLADLAVRFSRGARVWGPMAARGSADTVQRVRWEGGRFHVLRTMLPQLIRASWARRDLSLLDAIADLATPPLGLLLALVMAGTALTGGLALLRLLPWWTATSWLVALLALPLYVLVGLAAGRAPKSMYAALAHAPLFVLRKVFAYQRILHGFDPHRWDRTERSAAKSAASDARP